MTINKLYFYITVKESGVGYPNKIIFEILF